VRVFLSGSDELGGSSVEAFVLEPQRLPDADTGLD
jgi:hypothetical protein